MFTRINIRKTLILLSIFSIGLIIGVKIGASNYANAVNNTLNTKSVSEALNKPTQVSTVNNEVVIDKLKKSDAVVVKFEPISTQEPTQIIENNKSNDTCFDKTKFNKLSKTLKRKFKKGMD